MIIDTNVLAAADGLARHAGEHCAVRCREVIAEARDVVVALDDAGEILREYLRNVPHDRPYSVGFRFAIGLQQDQWDPGRVERVHIDDDVARTEPPLGQPALIGFDPSDRKFVAVALRSPSHPIKQALDSKWVAFDAALQTLGVRVEYVCPSIVAVAKGARR